MTNKVVTFTTNKRLPPRRGTNAAEPGTTLYAIQDTRTKLYFIWCYTNEAFAHTVAKTVAPDNHTDILANWRKSTDALIHTDRKS